jgi:rSAM/selenodomain-associated transferase 1
VKAQASGPILVLFARPPREGEAKTRLASSLGPEQAHAIYVAFLRDSIELLRRVSPWGIRAAIAWSSEISDAEVAALGEDLRGIETLRQQGDDLGQRMSSCIADLLAAGHDRVAIIGADTPSLPVEILKRAFELLRDRDLVFGPSTDGGYYLIGARSVVPEIFRGIPWGTGTVLAETLRILKIFGLPRVLLPEWADVDTPADLERLRAGLAALPETDPVARHTRAALRTLPPPPPAAP